ncbi:hypothetical protein [Helicobacter sp. MIT 14-3879]|uniref:hypothetical protein n=1 Tax=Helicobacter sp. MIT 14-3879 TaxID=2040649 RepID=UPI000E1FB377|nr:hypothetical protein [Helicobacter sp. MIT 14-3879]RDU61855.1 hypothetical protein CQA44_07970 [Helicobacter sp. MIT 14-3879]
MKILLVLIINICSCFAISQSEQEAFKSGFKTGLAMFEFQLKNEGIGIKQAEFNHNDFIVFVNTDKLPLAEILYLQYQANRDNFKTLLTKNELIFGSFEREADARDAIIKIKNLYDMTAKLSKGSDEFYINPIYIAKSYKKFIEEAKNNNNFIYTGFLLIKEQPQNNHSKKDISKTKQKYFKLKNLLTQSYINIFKGNSSNSFKESNIVEKQNRYILDKKVSTKEQEVFYKVKNKNLYFAADDVEEENE